MSIFKFLTKKSTLICLGLLVLLTFVPVEAWAKASADKTGPFSAFLNRAAILFMQTRNALFVIAAFAFVAYAWHAIQKGEVEWGKIFYLIVALVILGVAGWIVSYLADPSSAGKSGNVVSEYKEFGDTKGWDD